MTVAEYVYAIKADEVRADEIVALEVDDTPVAFTRLDGRIVAFGDVCTHDDGPLHEGTIEDHSVVCPRHGAHFDLYTGKPTFPAPYPIPIYETKIEGDDVLVKLTQDEGEGAI